MRRPTRLLVRSVAALCLALAASSCGGDPPTTEVAATDSTVAGTPPAGSNTAATSPYIFEQVPEPNRAEAQTSQVAEQSEFPPTIVADDFTLAERATVVGVSWQGIYCIEAQGAPASPPTASGFVIAVYPDVTGGPALDSPLFNTSLDIAAVNQTLVDTRTDLGCGSVTSTWDTYEYSAVLPTEFAAEAGTRYWISVQAITPTYEAFWAWLGSTAGDGNSLQEYAENVTTLSLDRAFTLTD